MSKHVYREIPPKPVDLNRLKDAPKKVRPEAVMKIQYMLLLRDLICKQYPELNKTSVLLEVKRITEEGEYNRGKILSLFKVGI